MKLLELFGLETRSDMAPAAGAAPPRHRPGPRAIIRREFREAVADLKREYEAGATSRHHHGWTTQPVTSDYKLRQRLQNIRARSRWAADNDPYMKRFLGLVRSNVVGPRGLDFDARIFNPDGTKDDRASGVIVDGWGRWGEKGICDVTERLTWVEAQALFAKTVAKDGECLVRFWRGRQFGPHGFRIQFLDPELLDVTLEKLLPNGGYIRMGVEFDKFDRPVAYHLIRTDDREAASYYPYLLYGKNHTRVPVEDLYHDFVIEDIGQKRGVPWAHAALVKMNAVTAYADAAMIAARIGAAKMGFYEEEPGAYSADDVEDAENPDDSEMVEEVEPGMIRRLQSGVKFTGWDPQYPHEQFEPFLKAALRSVSAGLNTSYNAIALDLENTNYSSLRAGRIEDEDIWMGVQNWMADGFATRVYREWLPMALLTRQLDVLGQPLRPDRITKYHAINWQGRRWRWVDPYKEAKGINELLKAKVISRSGVIRERAEKPDEVFDEIADDEKKLREKGVDITPPADTPAPGDDREDDENE